MTLFSSSWHRVSLRTRVRACKRNTFSRVLPYPHGEILFTKLERCASYYYVVSYYIALVARTSSYETRLGARPPRSER